MKGIRIGIIWKKKQLGAVSQFNVYEIARLDQNKAEGCSTKLLLKSKELSHGSELVHFKVQPGTLIIFPGYLEHEFTVDHGKDLFRFIHWNIQAVPKMMAKNVEYKLAEL